MLAKFTGLKSPTFDDYIEDLSILFEAYPTKGDQQLYEVRKAMALIDDLAAVADKLPELPREKGKQMRLTEQQKNCPYCHKPYKPFVSTGTEPANGLSEMGVSNVLGEVPIAEDALGIINVLKVPNCPFCRRPLNKEPER